MSEAPETFTHKLEKIKVILGVVVIAVPLIGTSLYWIYDKIYQASQFVQQVKGVNAAELGNTLDWLELEILRIRYAELVMQSSDIARAKDIILDNEARRVLSVQSDRIQEQIRANLIRQDEINQAFKERNRK